MRASIFFLLAPVALFACATPDYVYRPQTANAVASGVPVARNPVPPERPQGSVETASFGVTLLQQGDVALPALHIRMTVSNDGDSTPWQVDTRRQTIDIAGQGRATPLFANADAKSMPILLIPRGQKRVIDLYFPLPGTVKDASGLPKFDLLWHVETPERLVSSRTSFERMELEPVDMYAGYWGMGWPSWSGYGPFWWYDPFFPSAAFVGTQAVNFDHRGPVTVGRFNGHFAPGAGQTVARGGRH